jgi:hypothetical protein
LRLDHTGPAAVGLVIEGDRCTVTLDRLIDAAVVFLPNDEARIAEAEVSWAGQAKRAGVTAE